MNTIKEIRPEFGSKLVDTLFDLELIRFRVIKGSTPPWIYYDLKEIIHLVESFASAKIEGNKTTLLEAAIDKIDQKSDDEAMLEIRNVQRGILYIEKHFKEGGEIDVKFIRELHHLATDGLNQQNGNIPGAFRNGPVRISKTNLVPPEAIKVPELIEDLIKYINAENKSKETVIKIAIAHHRFTAIHPFFDGNGRTARLLTYAMLLKSGFIVGGNFGSLNPMSIFGADRNVYFNKLAAADSETDEGIEEWCLFVAEGINKEIQKMVELFDKDNIVPKFILPAIKGCLEDKLISAEEEMILKVAIEKDIIQRSDIAYIFGTTGSSQTKASRYLGRMVEKGLIMPLPNESGRNSHKYVIRFANNLFLPRILKLMDEAGYLPVKNSLF